MHPLKLRALAIAIASLTTGCSDKPEHYTSTLQIARMQIIQDPTGGKSKMVDVELEYTDCPGEQREVFQEDSAFLECIARYKLGDKVPAEISFSKLADGHWDSEVDKIGDCVRTRDALDERSYEVVHECKDIVVNGVTVGFQCTRKPTPELLAKCPWFRRK